MTSWITQLFSSGVDKVVDSVADGLDNLFTSDEEKLILRNKLEAIRLEAKAEAIKNANEFDKEITKRWESDNEHIITRLVQPISYCAILVLFGIIVLCDGNIGEFRVDSAYIPLMETLLVTMTIAYFGSRGAEKTMKHYKSGK